MRGQPANGVISAVNKKIEYPLQIIDCNLEMQTPDSITYKKRQSKNRGIESWPNESIRWLRMTAYCE